MVCQISKRRHQSVDAACVSAAQCIVRGVQIFALLFPMFFTEVIGKQRPNMAFNLQYVLQKELPQILIKIYNATMSSNRVPSLYFMVVGFLKGSL